MTIRRLCQPPGEEVQHNQSLVPLTMSPGRSIDKGITHYPLPPVGFKSPYARVATGQFNIRISRLETAA